MQNKTFGRTELLLCLAAVFFFWVLIHSWWRSETRNNSSNDIYSIKSTKPRVNDLFCYIVLYVRKYDILIVLHIHLVSLTEILKEN